MNTNDTAVLKAACKMLADEYAPSATSVPWHLETVDRNLLAQKILLLPELDRALVFCKYYFGFSPADTGEILGIPNPKPRMACCAELLAVTLGVGCDIIDDASMEAAARRAMSSYMRDYHRTAAAPTYSYSHKLRRQLDDIRTIPRRGGVVTLFVKRALIAAMIATMMFTTALAASPTLREMVFGWVVNTFPKYSQIGAASVTHEPTEADFEILKQYYPTYVPDGYELYEVLEEFSPVIYDYRNSAGDSLSFMGDIPSGSLTGYNTEGSMIQELLYLGAPAFYWEQSGLTYFVWQQGGFQFDIVGKITKEETMKMAESTKLQK